MPTYYKSTTAGNWSSANSWATAADGTTGVPSGPPTNADDVIFNANGAACTIDTTTCVCKSVDFTGYTGTLTHTAAMKLTVSGNVTFVAGMTYTLGNAATSAFTIDATSTLTSAGKTVGNFIYNKVGGTLTLADDMRTSGNFTLTAGTLAGNFAVIFTGNTPTITPTVALSFYNLTRTGTASKTDYLLLAGNITVTNDFTCNGNSASNRMLVWSSVTGTQRRILATNVSVSNTDFRDISLIYNDIVCMGDSITTNGYWMFLQESFRTGVAWNVVNKGVSGNTTTQMLARFAADVTDSGATKYVVILGGVNDAAGGVAAATIESNLQAMYTAAKTAGITVIAVYITPWKGSASWSAAKQTVTDDVNAWITASATDVDYIIDAYSVLEDPGVADTLLAAYDSGDHLHLSSGGYDLLAATIEAGLSWTHGAPFDLSAATGGSGDAGGNAGITFTTADTWYYHAAEAGDQKTSTVGKWFTATNGGGAVSTYPPLPQDTMRFDANSFDSGGIIVTQDMPRIGAVDFTGATNTPTWTTSTSAYFHGSITLITGMTLTASTQLYTFAGRSSCSLTSSGKSWAKAFLVDAPGGTLTLADDLVTSSYVGHNNGNINDGNFNITATRYDGSSGGSKRLTIGTGTWTLSTTGNIFATSTGGTAEFYILSANTAGTIKITNSTSSTVIFAGGGYTYGNIWYAPGTGTGELDFIGSNTFSDIKFDGTGAFKWGLTAGTTTTLATLTISGGGPAAKKTIGSITAAVHTLTKSTPGVIECDYLAISYSQAGGAGASWYAGDNSDDNGNNTGWIFSDAPTTAPPTTLPPTTLPPTTLAPTTLAPTTAAPGTNPNILNVIPRRKMQGKLVELTITGTGFSPTSTIAFSGTGITINNYLVRNANRLVAEITIDRRALANARDLTITNPDMTFDMARGAFKVGKRD